MSNIHQLSHISSSSSTVTVPSGSSVAGGNENFPGDGQSMDYGPTMEVDGASGGQLVIDWQFYFDTISPNLSATLDELATMLDLTSDELDSIRKQYNTEHERCIHVLWFWLRKCTIIDDTQKLTHLHNALKEAGRKALAEKDIPTRNTYEYQENVNDKEKNVQNGKEALKIAKGVADKSARLGRYFQLKEEDIARIVSNTADSRKQGQQIVEACINQKLLCTRQQLCNGLNYIGNTMLINEMNEYWG